MRRVLFTVAVIALAGATVATAQFRLAGIYGSETDLGLQAGFYVPLPVSAQNLTFGMDGTFYFPDDSIETGTEVQTTFVEANGNLHFDLNETPVARIYGLAGFHYAFINEERGDRTGLETQNSDEFGANLGGGVRVRLFFGEIRYSFGGFDQLTITAGLQL